MTAPELAPARPVLRIRFRDVVGSDWGYILDSWRLGWRTSEDCRRLRGAQYRAVFDAHVVQGVLAETDTAVVIGCDPEDGHRIWCWLCFTPGPVVTLHYGAVRTQTPETGPLRRLGLFSRLVAAAGVRHDLVYTFRPSERPAWTAKVKRGLEAGLLTAARREAVTAVYHPVTEFLARRRRS